MSKLKTNPTIVIAGAGITGSVAALHLANHGILIKIIEQNWTAPERIVGELLQPGGYQALEAMGLSSFLENIDAPPIHGYVLQSNQESVTLNYESTKANSVCYGLGFKNEIFLSRLRTALQSHPFIECIEGRATQLSATQSGAVNGVYYSDKKNTSHYLPSDLCIAADGIFSELRNILSRTQKTISSFFIGFLLEETQLPSPNYGHVFTGGHAPVLAYPVGLNQVRILADYPFTTPPKRGEKLHQYLVDLVGKQLPENMMSSFNQALKKNKIKFMPNHKLHAQPLKKPGVVLLGDALNMRHPLTGGGMTVAFSDIYHLGKHIIPIFKSENNSSFKKTISKAIEKFYAARYQYVSGINILADALYNVFKHPNLKNACITYLSKGAHYSQEPLSLLSGLSQDTSLLMHHFFGVAWLGASSQWSKANDSRKIKNVYSTLKDAVQIVSPLYAGENPKSSFGTVLQITDKVLP